MNKFIAPEYLFDGNGLIQNSVLEIQNGRVYEIHHNALLSDYPTAISLNGILSPGFIDLQVNGGGAVLFNDDPSIHGLQRIVNAHNVSGTSHILPTVITDKIEVMEQAADSVSAALEQGLAGVLGIHFEGPHISEPKKGVHPEVSIRTLGDAEKKLYSRSDIGIKLITLDPDAVSLEDIKYLITNNCIVSVGHTNASYASIKAAIDAGASGFTHLYNAMSPLTGREPGAVGAALNSESVYAGIILDGFHVDYVSAKLAWKIKNQLTNSSAFPDSSEKKTGKLYLVSDAMSSIGSAQKSFNLFNQTVSVCNGRLTNEFGTLAGAHLNLLMAVQNTKQHLNISNEACLKMAITYPAEFIGLDANKFAVVKGSEAKFIQLDENLNLIQRHTY